MTVKYTMLRKDGFESPSECKMGVLISPCEKRAKIPVGWHRITNSFYGKYTGKEFSDGLYTVFNQIDG